MSEYGKNYKVSRLPWMGNYCTGCPTCHRPLPHTSQRRSLSDYPADYSLNPQSLTIKQYVEKILKESAELRSRGRLPV
jgi:hypothetical protein